MAETIAQVVGTYWVFMTEVGVVICSAHGPITGFFGLTAAGDQSYALILGSLEGVMSAARPRFDIVPRGVLLLCCSSSLYRKR